MIDQHTKNPPKLIASDLDGTLLDSGARLSDANRDAIYEMVKRGAHFVPTSGRAHYEIIPQVRDLDCVRYVISSNGARTYDKQTGNSIETLIGKEDFAIIYDVMKNYTVYFTVHHEGMTFVDENLSTRDVMEYYGINEYYKAHIKNTCVKMPNFTDYFGAPRAVEMVCGFFKYENELKDCIQRLSSIKGIFVTSSTAGSIEILSAKATKGAAVVSLAKELGIDICDTVAVGDSLNDLTMIEKAGLGVATANAVPALKDAAGLTVCSNDEDVAVHLLNELF